MPPDPRPIPRFVADSTQEGIPHGRFAERLGDAFREAVEEIEDLPDGVEAPTELDWFPERAWGGRVWVPCSARTDGPEALGLPRRASGRVRSAEVGDLSGATAILDLRGGRLLVRPVQGGGLGAA